MRGRLHGFNECLTPRAAFEASKLLGGDDDHLVATVYGYVLRTLASNSADEFAEACLGVLQKPISRTSLGGSYLPDF